MTGIEQNFISLPNENALPALENDFAQTNGGDERVFAENDSAYAAARVFLAAVSYSPYLTRLFLQDLPFVRDLAQNGFDATFDALLKDSFKKLSACGDRQALSDGLRVMKKRVALLTGIADTTGAWGLEKITKSLSLTALAALRAATAHLLRKAVEKGDLSVPDIQNPEKDCGFFILAMGKLGARELNYSSDIDLIFLFDADKTQYTGRRDITSFFVKFGRELVALMEERTDKGYVFRTDLRLRPDPASTPIALSTQAAEAYYEGYAQNWERAAFIKARAVAGDLDAGRAFLKDVTPFVWRRSIDFYVLEQIRSMKYASGAKIANGTPLFAHNIKLAQGGIREIEFFTQLQQLLWGGRSVKLRARGTLAALKSLANAGRISPEQRDFMTHTYVYLRTLEHRLQMRNDEQTQTLPETNEEMRDLARFCGFETQEEFEKTTRAFLTGVQTLYDALFAAEDGADKDGAALVFTGTDLPEETKSVLQADGFTQFDFIADTVRGWLSGRYRCLRSDKARLLVGGLLPVIFKALSKTKSPDAAFMHFDDFLKGLPSGVQLFSLFQSRPALLDLLAEIMGQAPALARELSARPELFDAFLDVSYFTNPPDEASLQADLNDALAAANGLEDVLDACRRFAREKRFQAAVFFLRDLTNARQTGETLSLIADLTIRAVIKAVKEDFAVRSGTIDKAQTAFILLGKAGSREMNFLSDLDILFLYDAPENAVSDGKSPLAPPVYFARLAQRIVNALTANTAQGVLWQVDMRLRPSGSAGPAATSFDAFQRYYEKDAWTWEYQALTKARVVDASPDLQKRVEEQISAALRKPRDKAALAQDINAMRDKMLDGKKAPSLWDVKSRAGGMTDIEFAAQYVQLAFAREHPDLLVKSTADVWTRAKKDGLCVPEKAAILRERYELWLDMTAVSSLCRDFDTTAEKCAARHGCASREEFERKFLREEPHLRAPYGDLIRQ